MIVSKKNKISIAVRKSIKPTVSLVMGLAFMNFANAACPDTSVSSNPEYANFNIYNGDKCVAPLDFYNAYNTFSIEGNGSSLTFTNLNSTTTVVSNAQSSTVVLAVGWRNSGINPQTNQSGATLIADHDMLLKTGFGPDSKGAVVAATKVDGLTNNLIINGNLTVENRAVNNKPIDSTNDYNGIGYGLYVLGKGGIATVKKDLTITDSTTDPTLGNGGLNNVAGEINILGNTNINVNQFAILGYDNAKTTFTGTTTVKNVLADTPMIVLRNGATTTFLGTLNGTSVIQALNNDGGVLNIFAEGTNTLKGNVVNYNNGLISLSNGKADGKLVIDGDYVGNNGRIRLDTQLGNDSSLTDFIKITGNLSGTTNLEINNVGGLGESTIKGIHIVETKTSTPNGLRLDDDNYLSAGKYVYSLELRKQEEKTNDNGTTLHDNWYLVNHRNGGGNGGGGNGGGYTYTPDIGGYIANDVASNTLFNMRLEDREGASQYQNLGDNEKGNVWIRAYGNNHQFKSMQDQLKTKGDGFVTQIGAGLVKLGEEDQYNLGAMVGYGHYDGKTKSEVVNLQTKSKINGYSVGLYGTWYAFPLEKRGAYLDSWVLWNKFKNTVDTADQHHYKYDSSGITASVEIGGNYLLNENGKRNWWIQPQGQLIHQGVKMDDFKDAHGIKFSDTSANLQSRIGVKTYLEIPSSEGAFTNYRPYIALNYIHNSTEYAVDSLGEQLGAQGTKNLGEIKLGLEGNIGKSSYVWANASYVAGSHSNQAYQGNIGWKYNF